MTRALRDSGIGWLGLVPSHWGVIPARALFGERKTRCFASDIHLTPSQKYGVLPQTEYMEITGNRVVLNLSGSDNMRHVEPGDYISHLRSFQGGLEHSTSRGKVSAAYTVLRPKRTIDDRYFKYLFKSDLYIQALQTTTDQLRDGQSIRYSEFSLIRLPQPPLVEQRAIADFLDRETAQIDAFIAKNEQLIALLTERRAAIIRHILRTGLGSASATQSADDAEYLGAVPAHWKVAGLVRYASTVSGAGFPEVEQGLESEAIAFYKVNALSRADADGVIRTQWDTISEATARRLRAVILPPGSLIMAKIGGALLLGRVRRNSSAACIDNNMMALVPSAGLDPRFAAYLVGTMDLALFANPGAVPSLNIYEFMHHKLAFPPRPEQAAIAEHLDAAAAEADNTIAAADRANKLARERRAALISAAVTGKIDVGVSA